ncbi:hypothetical protein LCGC14_0164730 [marine sediment metagenome]|uniref:Amidohydrolase-related domain-containing protein n=1 Tax=marine sediment metagenome TaxID=412755 RepID=A0A0F9UYN7_9ZZZZ
MEYVTPIDPHVHLRGLEYPDHSFMQWAIEDADAAGVAYLLEQPNPKPWLVKGHIIAERRVKFYKLSRHLYDEGTISGDVSHKCHIGLTTDYEQAVAAILYAKAADTAIKIFFVHSTGDMGILNGAYQQWLWRTIAMIGFTGPVIGHFEMESAFQGKFDPDEPLSHSTHQHENAEIIQIVKQLKWAHEAGFAGTFYIAHASSPKTVNFADWYRHHEKPPYKVVIEGTFHHLLLNWDDYAIHGNRVKMNPPLRSPASQEELLNQYLDGKIDVIGTDHAPHPVEAKDSSTPPSGIPALPFWPRGIEILRERGASEDLILRTTFSNANEIFGLAIEPETVEREYDITLWDKYGFNPFQRLS